MRKFIEKNKKDIFIYLGYIIVLIVLITLATAFQKTTPYNNIAIDFSFIGLDSVQVAWYAVFILSGILLGATMAYQEFKRLGWNTDILFDGLLIIAPLAIIGARLYYVLFDPNGSAETFMEVIAIWEGGLAIHGAVIVAGIGVVLFARYKKINVWALFDILAIGLLMGQIAGRWGNFMNLEAHGDITNNTFLISVLPNFITKQMGANLNSGIYHPTFLYEGLLNFVALTGLFILRRKRLLKAGESMGIYLLWYGLVRGLIIEPLRTDQLMIFGNIPVNILLSLVLFALGGIVIIVYLRFIKKDQPYYFDLLVDEEGLEKE
ncbi:MAG TPA: prolipoprotein diacylglyceryl transferase [Acholeplasmataceae bacterium]|nr:prolipoprotein diacylglyceryl transferase [Acholeplasmataceae bacterium]